MNNLEQIRAANALQYVQSGHNTKGKEGGNVLKKLPALVMNNGLLAAGAFAYAQKEDSGWRGCFDHLAKHLAHPQIGITPSPPNPEPSGHRQLQERDHPQIGIAPNPANLHTLMSFLTNADTGSQILKMATEEALAWLSYAKRFEQNTSDDEGDDTHH